VSEGAGYSQPKMNNPSQGLLRVNFLWRYDTECGVCEQCQLFLLNHDKRQDRDSKTGVGHDRPSWSKASSELLCQ
jgi:hypothetical protein